MVSMDKLPAGQEFAKEGGVQSIARNVTHETVPAYAMATKILISRGVNALALDANYKHANPEKSPLYNVVLAHDGINLGEGKTQINYPKKTYAAVKEAEEKAKGNVSLMKSFTSKGLGD